MEPPIYRGTQKLARSVLVNQEIHFVFRAHFEEAGFDFKVFFDALLVNHMRGAGSKRGHERAVVIEDGDLTTRCFYI